MQLAVYHDFVDRYLVSPLRRRQVQLPLKVIDDRMQGIFNTYLQEYVYHLAMKVQHKSSVSLFDGVPKQG